ncbi:vWA domain-containing protein [Urbifossiella limnaea]|uniref:von Willebrand factor type A domain protein n=1 Tax=Urbifossiella limnaea TaxID=2528023 RepID=A0A517XTW4_9BACT|nr:VWA domain-containing protein [Urbifossiella limnaea]QDU20942.1 von Willebrand factor type A domain protein [Urbifossiella limnaea]
MPGFAAPEFLWLAPLALPLVWWWARRRRTAVRYSDLRLVAALPGSRPARARWGGALLRGLAFASLAVACAGPRTTDERTRLPAEGIAIVLALDVSGSMTEKDAVWSPAEPPLSRLEAAKRAFRLFVAGGDAPDGTRFDPRESDAIGLVAFAVVPQTVCPLTLNHSVLLKVAAEQEPRSVLDAGTNVGDALAEGVIRLDRGGGTRKKVLILLSDGEHNVSKEGDRNPLTPRQAAQLAANLQVKVYTIDAGGPPPPDAAPEAAEQRAAGKEALRVVAEMTGGRSFAASSGADLLAAYREISALEKTAFVTFQYRRYFDHTPWAAGLAAALLAVAQLLDRTRWRVLP